jgi:hypothetical protein
MPEQKQVRIQSIRVVSNYPYAEKCKVFQTAFWLNLQITCRLNYGGEVITQFCKGLERVDSCRSASGLCMSAYSTFETSLDT